MLKSQACVLCRSIVRGWGTAAGLGRRYRSIQASAVLAHVLIRSPRPLSPAAVRLRRSCLRSFSIMAAAGSRDDAGIVLKLVAASVCIADRAGGVVRNVMSAGDLGIVEKVRCSSAVAQGIHTHCDAIMQTID